MITGDYRKINDTLKNFSRNENIRLFKTISKGYAFYSDMLQHKNLKYWFKIDPNKKFYGKSDKQLIINIMGTREQADPSHPAITHSIDYEINYIQRPEEIQEWIAEYTSIVRELKLNNLIPTNE